MCMHIGTYDDTGVRYVLQVLYCFHVDALAEFAEAYLLVYPERNF